ncbi:Rab-protein geranylgeranyltransferase [Rhizoctonia solani]|uniref:Geranylgeranyl transferase type-2 subunit alpha n=1 Tax=Rhizoctonia solani TaxID=456999 RepID=A0A8H7IDV5_9AGAM|nr:Rab-protein geranylgeranyltransferase [Rhizoctonia solani]
MEHGIKRIKQTEEAIKAQKERERVKIDRLVSIEKDVFDRRSKEDLSQESLEATTTLLALYPELYTAWNFRRTVLADGIFPKSSPEEVFKAVDGELSLTLAALQVHPKVYWLWNHRRWCLENIPDGPEGAEKSWKSSIWARELAIVEKMLDRDSRNFHAWNYRRYVLASVPEPDRRSPESELAYTTRKIEQNFSNFSAWHQRTKVFGVLWRDRPELEAAAKSEEFEFVRNALWTDPGDQSAWLYHRWLIGKGDDAVTVKSEISSIEELVVEVGSDSKWPLQALVHYKSLLASHDSAAKPDLLRECRTLTERLIQIDPMRQQMYQDQRSALDHENHPRNPHNPSLGSERAKLGSGPCHRDNIQTVVCQAEVETLPILDHDRPLERSDSHYGTFSGHLVGDQQYFLNPGPPDLDAHTIDSSRGESGSIDLAIDSGLRVGNIFIDDKVLYLLGACMGVFAVGLNDTATGANLPSIQEHYDLPYAIVSLVFLAGFGGYLISCMLNSVLQNAIGTPDLTAVTQDRWPFVRRRVFVNFICTPFPTRDNWAWLMGFGGGFYEACLTSIVSHFDNSKFMNILYAFFGLGALVSPFIIGALVKAGVPWNTYYWFPLSLALLVTLCHVVLFKDYVTPSDHEHHENTEQRSARTSFIQIMRLPITWIGIILIILSFAISDTLSSWLTSYLIEAKGSEPDVSRYQLSINEIYCTGLTCGRIFFSLPFIHVRERLGNTLLLACAGGALAVLWNFTSPFTNWATIAIAGFFLGPNTPGILSIVSARVPPSLKGIVISITIGLGLVGATLGPLLFGIVVGKVGPGLRILPPVIIVLASLSAITFWTIPPRTKRD